MVAYRTPTSQPAVKEVWMFRDYVTPPGYDARGIRGAFFSVRAIDLSALLIQRLMTKERTNVF